MMNGLDILVLLKLCALENPRIQSKVLASQLHLSPSEITQSLKRCRASGLLSWSEPDKCVNRAAFLEFLVHGFRYVFPAETGSMTRGIPTGAAAEPLRSRFIDSGEPPAVWPHEEGTVRGFAYEPIHRRAPEAALQDPRLYQLLAMVDGLRGNSIRERQVAKEEIAKRLVAHA
jgi:hypothetical protein